MAGDTPYAQQEPATGPLAGTRPLGHHREMALRAVALPVLGLVVCMVIGTVFGKSFVVQRAVKCLSFPIIAYFYLNRPSERVQALYATPSPTSMGWSLAGFFFAVVATQNWAPYGLVLGVVSGLFLWVRPMALWQLLRSQGQAGLLVGLGALSGPLLIVLQRYVWQPLADMSIAVMQLGMDTYYRKLSVVTKADVLSDHDLAGKAKAMGMIGKHFSRSNSDFTALMSDSYYIQFNAMNNALVGLSMLPFMLALLLLLRERLFRRLPLQKTVLAGIALVMGGVPLLLAALFPLGQAGAQGDAGLLTSAVHEMLQTRSGPWAGTLAYAVVEGALMWCMLRFLPRHEGSASPVTQA